MILASENWFSKNIFYICFSIVLAFIIFVCVCLIIKLYLDKEKYKTEIYKKGVTPNELYDNLIEFLGGIDNISSVDYTKKDIRLSLKKGLEETSRLESYLKCHVTSLKKHLVLSDEGLANDFAKYIEYKLIVLSYE